MVAVEWLLAGWVSGLALVIVAVLVIVTPLGAVARTVI